jgi:hypothetical protein
MASRQLKPYRQGRLDGLCGVCTLINALRLLCPRLDEDDCERAFCALIRARARQAASPVAVIHGGLSRRELLRLIGSWQGTVNLIGSGRDKAGKAGHTNAYAQAATPLTSAQVWKAWVRSWPAPDIYDGLSRP